MDMTKVYDGEIIENAYMKELLKEVMTSIQEKGYQPVNQIVGYLMSGDPGYITNYQDARLKITTIERSKWLEFLVREMMKWQDI